MDYKLFGFIDPLVKTDFGFINPIFEKDGCLFTHFLSQDKKLAFAPVNPGKNSIIRATGEHVDLANKLIAKDNLLYSFLSPDKTILVGFLQDIYRNLTNKEKELATNPFSYISVLVSMGSVSKVKFLGEIIKDQVFNDNTLADRWVTNNVQAAQKSPLVLTQPSERLIKSKKVAQLTTISKNHYCNFWELSELVDLILVISDQASAQFQLMRSLIGQNPKVKEKIECLGLTGHVGKKSREIVFDKNTSRAWKAVNTQVAIFEIKANIPVLDTTKHVKITIENPNRLFRYVKKDSSKICKEIIGQDYVITTTNQQ